MTKETNKPVIESIINTAALALSVFAVTEILKQNYYGFLVLGVCIGIEWLKYWGRRKYW
jgi:hypothetical protein